MNAEYPTDSEAMTLEHVLDVFRDSHRQQCQYDHEADPEICLTPESSVAEWREACDLLGWKKLGRALNSQWEISLSDASWHATLEPAREKRLADVAEIIAQRSDGRPVIRSAHLLGATSTSAGTFLTIRSLLRQAGADAETISPSTPLAAYTRRYPHLFLGPISQLAPGAMPAVRIHQPVYTAGNWSFAAGLLSFAASWLSDSNLLMILGGTLLASGWLLTWITTKCIPPSSVSFGDLHTFRDLADAIADGSHAHP